MNNLNSRKRELNQLNQLAKALLVILSISAKYSEAINDNNLTNAETKSDPSHLSWTSNNTRYDFVFNTNGTIKGLVKLESDPSNFLSNSLTPCTDHSACLFRNGTYLEAFQVASPKASKSIFTPVHHSVDVHVPSNQCDTGNKFEVLHYCSTSWNPPLYLTRINCKHIIEWHSPLTCHSNTTNHERPCYIYDPAGKLIDLSHWILSNGSSYEVALPIGNETKVKQFNINVCNEAHDSCGPNVSACFIDGNLGTVESGYNNLTSIKYDAKDQAVLLTSLGHFKPQCEDSRLKTVIRFICKNKVIPKTGPKLVRSTACESIIEWPTIRACPVSEVQAPATDCRIKYEPLGLDMDLRKLANNKTMVEIPNIKIDGTDKKMLIGVCQGISRSVSCGGKLNSNTQSCLIDAHDNSTVRSATNSDIVGSMTKSIIRLTDERIYLESSTINKTCTEAVRSDFNVTRKVGTRVEFFCSDIQQDRPTFLGYDDCTYIFEWGTPHLCLEATPKPSANFATPTVATKPKLTDPKDTISKINKNINVKEVIRSGSSKSATVTVKPQPAANNIKLDNAVPPKMNSAHKFFMISLIVMSFAAFIVVIFVLDKKTRLRITLRQARQAFQTNNQQPYSRVVSDLDL